VGPVSTVAAMQARFGHVTRCCILAFATVGRLLKSLGWEYCGTPGILKRPAIILELGCRICTIIAEVIRYVLLVRAMLDIRCGSGVKIIGEP